MTQDEIQGEIEAIKAALASIRQYRVVRFTVLPVFLASMGGLADKWSNDEDKLQFFWELPAIPIAGLLASFVFGSIEVMLSAILITTWGRLQQVRTYREHWMFVGQYRDELRGWNDFIRIVLFLFYPITFGWWLHELGKRCEGSQPWLEATAYMVMLGVPAAAHWCFWSPLENRYFGPKGFTQFPAYAGLAVGVVLCAATVGAIKIACCGAEHSSIEPGMRCCAPSETTPSGRSSDASNATSPSCCAPR